MFLPKLKSILFSKRIDIRVKFITDKDEKHSILIDAKFFQETPIGESEFTQLETYVGSAKDTAAGIIVANACANLSEINRNEFLFVSTNPVFFLSSRTDLTTDRADEVQAQRDKLSFKPTSWNSKQFKDAVAFLN